MFQSAVDRMINIHSWGDAVRHFRNTKQVRSHRWAPNERPLHNTRTHHYRLVRVENDAYDLMHYRTTLIRYLKPEDDGTKVVLLRGWDSTNSWAFLREHGWATWDPSCLYSASGGHVCAPLNIHTVGDYTAANGVVVPEGFSALFAFKGGLRLDRSAHRPVYAPCATEEDSDRRRAFKERAKLLADLVVHRIPYFHEHAEVRYALGGAFNAHVFKGDNVELNAACSALEIGLELDESQFKTALDFGQAVYNTYLANWADDNKVEVVHTTSNGHTYTSNRRHPNPQQAPHYDVAKFRTAYVNGLMSRVGLNVPTGKRELPQFPEKLPRKCFY